MRICCSFPVALSFSVPGNVAQPPFSMSDRRSQDSQDKDLLNATGLAAASVCCWNFSTQIGASTLRDRGFNALGYRSLSSTAECQQYCRVSIRATRIR
jgi:hypothetical protein